MLTGPYWQEDLPSLLNGSLSQAGFTGRLVFPNASEPLAFPCLLAYSLYLHSQITYSKIQDFITTCLHPKIQPILTYGADVYRMGHRTDWWTQWGEITLQTITNLPEIKSHLLAKVNQGTAITFNDTQLLNSVVTSLKLSIEWVEDQEERPLTHIFTNSGHQDPALFVYFLQFDHGISLLYHKDMDLKEGFQRFPYFTIVGEPYEPFVIGDIPGQSPKRHQSVLISPDELTKDVENRITAAAFTVIRDFARVNIPIEAVSSLNTLKETISHYHFLLNQGRIAPIDLSPLQEVLSEGGISRKCMPKQHKLSECREIEGFGGMRTLVCGHIFHSACLKVYINLQSDRFHVNCPLCKYNISQETIRIVCPEYYEYAENAKNSTFQRFAIPRPIFSPSSDPGFPCQKCQCTVHQTSYHGCSVCLDCMTNGILCGVCGQPLSAEDIALVQATMVTRR